MAARLAPDHFRAAGIEASRRLSGLVLFTLDVDHLGLASSGQAKELARNIARKAGWGPIRIKWCGIVEEGPPRLALVTAHSGKRTK